MDESSNLVVDTLTKKLTEEINCFICYEVKKHYVQLRCQENHICCLECALTLLMKSVQVHQSTFIPRVAMFNSTVKCPVCQVTTGRLEAPNGWFGLQNPNRQHTTLVELYQSVCVVDEKAEQAVQIQCACKHEKHETSLQIIKQCSFQFECPFSRKYRVKDEKEYQCFIVVENGFKPTNVLELDALLTKHLATCKGLVSCDYCDRVVEVSKLQTHLRKHKRVCEFSRQVSNLANFVSEDMIANPLIGNLSLCFNLLNVLKLVVVREHVSVKAKQNQFNPELDAELKAIDDELKKWPISNNESVNTILDMDKVVHEIQNGHLCGIRSFISSVLPLFRDPQRCAKSVECLESNVAETKEITSSLSDDEISIHRTEYQHYISDFSDSELNDDDDVDDEEEDHSGYTSDADGS